MTDPCKNNAFTGSERGVSGGFSANQSKPWRHGEHSYNGIVDSRKQYTDVLDFIDSVSDRRRENVTVIA